MGDLYFDENYGRLYEEIENGKCEVFEFHHSLGTIRHMFIKREIPLKILGKIYFDIVTPYGYGGPLITECEPGKQEELTAKFMEAFQEYCKENDIVSEFIRFHPVIANAHDFKNCYEVSYIRNTVGTNLKDYDDPVQKEFSKSTRKNIRKALNDGVEFKITVNPPDLGEFINIYHHTMKRNKADTYYYFDEDYFKEILGYFGKNILLVETVYEGQVIGMGLNFVYGETIHTHLSGTLEEFHRLSPAYILQYALVEWGKENGFNLIHDGGGRTNSLDDKLYAFKKQFGKNTNFKFYIGQKIWNEPIYDQLCQAAGVERETEFFPAYRSAVKREYSNNIKLEI
ncbi:GNAT family N-acetyltransferase [Planococcus shenhongbingii]|uniref:lipid II:glycine glycyltransferase FemX n=1 Tax=Planococcus shenhongbingii TaxID=3058398 RepID=UPI00261C1058|nr:GNAT family N-acetyltransferase [Planococcus sp. N016]WKA57703.1 GNAT family N-acetyltransferase [Planococcus sp. N016]